MQIPEELRYTKDHEWVRIEGDTVVVGITEFAQSELGDLVFVDLPAVGKVVKQKDTICVVESTKAASDVYSPLSGKVSEANVTLKDAPGAVNTAPYGDGWLVKLKETSAAELGSLLTAAQYKNYLGEKA